MTTSGKSSRPDRASTAASKPMPRARMHHYLPVSYLKRFTDASGFLHVLDFTDQKTFKTKPNNVAKIRDFYTTETTENPEDERVEKFIALLEGKAEPAFSRIIRENRIDHESEAWSHVCEFIALLDRRLPISRAGYKQTADWMMNIVAEAAFGTKDRLEATLKRIQADTGKKLDLDSESARQLIDDGCISADVPRNAHIRLMLETAAHIAPLVWNMTPHLLIAEDAHFITGDCPLAKRNRQPVSFLAGVGWASPTIEIAIPIGQRHCIMLTWDPEPHVLSVDRLAVANINCRIAQWAMRYVLAPHERFAWMDQDESVRTGSKALMKKFGSNKENRQLIQTWPPQPGTSQRMEEDQRATPVRKRTKRTRPRR